MVDAFINALRLNKQLEQCLFLSWLLASPLVYAQCQADSGFQQQPLVELYTSEGCSSCPPADEWLAGIRTPEASQAHRVASINLAFHVTYWDSLGWRDRFANAAYDSRQRRLAANQHAAQVYTPEVFVNGQEVRRWYRVDRNVLTKAASSSPVRLMIGHNGVNQGYFDFDYRWHNRRYPEKQLYGYLAQTAAYAETQVKQGENANRRLKHVDVVRDWRQLGRLDGAQGQTQLRVPVLSGEAGDAEGDLVLVVADQNGAVVQAVKINKQC